MDGREPVEDARDVRNARARLAAVLGRVGARDRPVELVERLHLQDFL